MTSLSGNPPDDRDANDRDANHALALRIEFSRPDGGKPEIIAAIPSTRQRVAVKGDRGGKKKSPNARFGLNPPKEEGGGDIGGRRRRPMNEL
jgi:hypothetical protein